MAVNRSVTRPDQCPSESGTANDALDMTMLKIPKTGMIPGKEPKDLAETRTAQN